jgi:hypothetical protein
MLKVNMYDQWSGKYWEMHTARSRGFIIYKALILEQRKPISRKVVCNSLGQKQASLPNC